MEYIGLISIITGSIYYLYITFISSKKKISASLISKSSDVECFKMETNNEQLSSVSNVDFYFPIINHQHHSCKEELQLVKDILKNN